MAKKQKPTTAERLAEQDAKAQADEIARIISATCDLLDYMATSSITVPVGGVIGRMKAYLDRRGVATEAAPVWVAKMRRTVRTHEDLRSRLRGDDVFSLD